MRGIKQIENIKGKRILVRVDFNVPIKDGKVESDFRIQKALPTIKFLQEQGAKLILITHLGKSGETLAPVAEILNDFVKTKFISKIFGEEVDDAISSMKDGEVILLENLRNDKGEQSKDPEFASNLAKYADIYVNEAFPVSHREDASLVILPKLLPAFAGFQLEEEVKNLSHTFSEPKHPFLFILGGDKFSTKIPLLQKYLELADYVFIGGAIANSFLKAKGYQVGESLVEDIDYDISKILQSNKLILPVDVLVKSSNGFVNRIVSEIEKDEFILDIGEETIKNLGDIIKNSKLILWNGPLGKYEDGGAEATKKILKLIPAGDRESIIGGGDTVALITEMKMEKDFSFISTGGGATLDFLANGTLPGIKAL